MTQGPTPFRALPPPVRALVIALSICAAGVTAACVPGTDVSAVPGIVALAACVAAAEGFRFSLPYQAGQLVRFTPVDAVVTAALVVAPLSTIVLGAAAGVLVWQLVDRLPGYKLLYNQAQLVLGGGAAALVMQALGQGPGGSPATPAPATLPALSVALGVVLAVNTVTVSGIVSLASSQPFGPSVRRMLPTNAVMTLCNGSIGLLAVVLGGRCLWAVPALLAPLALVHTSSRQRVSAQLQRERAGALMDIEHELAAAADAGTIARVIARGAAAALAGSSAVWRQGEWVTAVPVGSGPCPISTDAEATVTASTSSLGPAAAGTAGAVGLGGGVLVVWWDRALPDGDVRGWLEHLGRSARVHFDRLAVTCVLERERATLRAVVDGSSNGIFVVDRDGALLLCNPAMARLIGESAAELVGRPLSTVLGDGPWHLDGAHAHERPTGIARYADTRTWRVAMSSVFDQTLSDLRIGVVHDVSARRRVDRMKDDMFAVVSHELRTPLTPIKATAQLLSRKWEELDDAKRRHLLTRIEERADHLARLVDDMLLVAQLSGEQGPPAQPVSVDVAALVRGAVADLARERPGHRLVYAGPDALEGCTDPAYLRRLLAHLVENGCKFSPPATAVTITLTVDGADAVLCVSDRGRGIPPEDVERVFDRFERVEDPLRMRTPGAGLGLYIVRALTKALGGTVALDSTLGRGTTVVLRLPLRASDGPHGLRGSAPV